MHLASCQGFLCESSELSHNTGLAQTKEHMCKFRQVYVKGKGHGLTVCFKFNCHLTSQLFTPWS